MAIGELSSLAYKLRFGTRERRSALLTRPALAVAEEEDVPAEDNLSGKEFFGFSIALMRIDTGREGMLSTSEAGFFDVTNTGVLGGILP